MAHGDFSMTEQMLVSRYSLTTVFGVANMLKDIHTLREKRFQGTDTTFLSCMLLDFETVVSKAELTKRQSEALFLHFEKDLSQVEVAEEMNVTQQAISKHIDTAITKIVAVAKEEETRNEDTF